MLLLLLDTFLLFGFALLVGATLRLPTRTAFVLGLWLIMFAAIILPVQVAGMFSVIKYPAIYLGAHLSLLAAGALIWDRAGRPVLAGPFAGNNQGAASSVPTKANQDTFRQIVQMIRGDLALWLLGIGVLIGYLIGALVIIMTPPTTPDDMLYHFPRIAFWLQHNSLRHWDTYKMHQVVFAINGELGMAWTVIFTGTDTMARFIHWVAAGAAGVVVIGLARLMGYSRREGLFAALFVLATPQVYLQATAANNDLLLAALFGSAIYLLILGLRTDHWGALGLSALALGITPGIKMTLVTMSLGLVTLLLILWWEHGRRGFRRLLAWGIASLAVFVVFSSYNYILNWVDYDLPFGPSDFRKYETGDTDVTRLDLLRDNPPRYVYQSFDVSGIPRRLSIPLHELKVSVAKKLFDLIGQADPATSKTIRGNGRMLFYERPTLIIGNAWFGPLGTLLLWAVLPQTIWAIRRRDVLRLALVIMAWEFWFMLSIFTDWTLHRGRYVTLLVVLIAPLIIPLYQMRARRWLRPAYWMVCGLAVVVLISTQLGHEQVSPIGGQTNWGRSDMAVWRFFGVYYPAFVMVEKHVPDDAHLGLYFKEGDMEYPFFGRKLTRTITPIYPYPEKMDAAWLAANEFDYLVVNNTIFPFDDLPAGLEIVEQGQLHTLLRVMRPVED